MVSRRSIGGEGFGISSNPSSFLAGSRGSRKILGQLLLRELLDLLPEEN